MKYATLKTNDTANGQGIGVSFFVQGCPHHCKGCFNPETWDFSGGEEFTQETLDTIISALTANDVKRHLSVLGGEPLCLQNQFLTALVISEVKKVLPTVEVYVWTGYTYEELDSIMTPQLRSILAMTDTIIDGPYIEELRDITLPMRGSSNQRIINLKKE